MAHVYSIYWDQPDYYTSSLKLLDGDFKQVYPTGFEFNPNSTDPAAAGNLLQQEDRTFVMRIKSYQGLPVDLTHVPTRIQYQGKRSEIVDLMMTANWFFMTEKLKTIIEELEPGVHQFKPVELVDAKGAHLADYFWFVPCNRVDSMDREHTTHEFYEERKWKHENGKKYVVSLKQTASYHLWIDPRLSSGSVFISQTLHDALVAADLKGIGFGELETI